MSISKGLGLFTGVPVLKELEVQLDCTIQHELRLLAEHRKISRLFLSGLQATMDLSPLADLPELSAVFLNGYRDEALAGISEMDQVTTLTLANPVGQHGIEHTPRVFRSTKDLHVYGFEPLDLVSMARMASIKDLMLQNSKFDTIAPLAQLADLRKLSISNNVNFDYDLRPLAISGLEYVELDHDRTYIGIEHLQGVVQL